MTISKERLIKEQKATGYRQEIIEKVVWLMQILNAIADDSFLRNKLALKGGTALNLFHFNLPRLSVDADLNYIGAIDKEIMQIERSEIIERIHQLFQRMGLTIARDSLAHASTKMTWRYASALGNQGNLEVDLNFMYRLPLLPIENKSSIKLAGQEIKALPLLDIHELAAGKLAALIDRGAGRDFFDAFHLFQYSNLDMKKLRLLFITYAAMSSKPNIINLNINDIKVNHKDLQNKLIPVMAHNFFNEFSSISEWKEHLIDKVKQGFNDLLPLNNPEKLFISTIHEHYQINPELITDDKNLIQKIKSHPALLWAAKRQAIDTK